MAKDKIKKEVLERVGKSLKGVADDISPARLSHIISKNGLSGQTTEKISEEVVEHVVKTPYGKVNSLKGLKKFGQAYADDITEFAQEVSGDFAKAANLGADLKIDKAAEKGFEVNGRRKITGIDITASGSNGSYNITTKPSAEYSSQKKSFIDNKQREAEKAAEAARLRKEQMKAAKEEFERIEEEKGKYRNYTDRDFKKNMYKTKEDYQRFNINNEYRQAATDLKNKNYENPVLKSIKANNKGVKLEDMTQEMLDARRLEAIAKAKGDLDFRGNMGFYRVPEKAAGAVGTLWLVNKLASSSGQQTNAQLYGQQGY